MEERDLTQYYTKKVENPAIILVYNLNARQLIAREEIRYIDVRDDVEDDARIDAKLIYKIILLL